jgi:hypothetical protein
MYYVAVDDGEHMDKFFESTNLFETLCEYHETMIDPRCQHYEWVEWGSFTEDSIDTEDFFHYSNAN